MSCDTGEGQRSESGGDGMSIGVDEAFTRPFKGYMLSRIS